MHIQTEEERSRSFIRGKKESLAEITKGWSRKGGETQEEEEEMPVGVRCDSIAVLLDRRSDRRPTLPKLKRGHDRSRSVDR